MPQNQWFLICIELPHELKVVWRVANADDDNRNWQLRCTNNLLFDPLIIRDGSVCQDEQNCVLHVFLLLVFLNNCQLVVDLLEEGAEMCWTPEIKERCGLLVSF